MFATIRRWTTSCARFGTANNSWARKRRGPAAARLGRPPNNPRFVSQSVVEQLNHPIHAPRPPPEGCTYTDFNTMVDELRSVITAKGGGAECPDQAAEITELLASARFNPREWGQYTNFVGNRYTRTLVGCDPKFVVLLLCWEKGQMSPIHCHARSSCWVKVLSGQLQESIYEFPQTEDGAAPLRLTSESIFGENQATYMEDSYGVHRMGNPRDDIPCVSLHVYSPAYSSCGIFDRVSGARSTADLKTVYTPFTHSDYAALAAAAEAEAARKRDQDDSKDWVVGAVDKISLDTFVDQVTSELARPASELRPAAIGALLSKLVLSKDEWERFVNFGSEAYTRNLLLVNEAFSLMLLCWGPGQATPLHRHGMDRRAWFKVLDGELTVNHYEDQGAGLASECKQKSTISDSMVVRKGDPVVYESPDDTCHTVGNSSATATAVSIHVYSPPYLQLVCDDQDEKAIPVVHYGKMFNHSCAPSGTATYNVYSNFSSFKTLLDHTFSRFKGQPDHPGLHEAVTALMSQIQFNPEEWRSHVQLHKEHFTRVLLGESEEWMLILTCWDKGQETPIHDHQGSYNWIKVLEGQMIEETYSVDNPSDRRVTGTSHSEGHFDESQVRKLRSGVLPVDSVTFLDQGIVHRIRNVSNKPTISLHLYSPPYRKVKAYDTRAGDSKLVFLPTIHG